MYSSCPSPEDIQSFQNFIFKWWKSHERVYPWRVTENPYHILVSEFMLQQTQANRVVKFYNAFLRKFPDMESLSTSPLSDVLIMWQGLGYNRRAKWLKEACTYILTLPSFPRDPQLLMKIRGIGPYTSNAVLIFAFNMQLAAVDINILRTLTSFGFVNHTMTPRETQKIALLLTPTGNSRDWHNALMDYGSKHVTNKQVSSSKKSPKFENSTRQARGFILKLLTKVTNNRYSISSLSLHSEVKNHNLDQILSSLIRDGLICSDGNFVCLPKH